MSTNPRVNALLAAGYISTLATIIFNMPNYVTDNQLGVMAPILFLSLFVFSAALMGYLFFYQSVILLIDHKPKEAASQLLATVAAFAGFTLLIILAWFALQTFL